MSEPLILQIRAALNAVADPATGKSVVASGAVQGLSVDDDGVARFTLVADSRDRDAAEALLTRAKEAAGAVPGVTKVAAVATAHAAPGQPRSGHANPLGLSQQKEAEAPLLTDIGAAIAVASGKGGVGKSTIAANLAIALARLGKKVGFLDADIYGPSAPLLFGIDGKAETRDGKMIPIERHGVKVMSIAMLVDPDKALAWRGPMATGAIRQLMRDVEWGPLDILIVDTPPGTGDIHLSLVQANVLTGAVIVSTPQAMAIADMRRGVELFRKTNIPILGVIENMAYLPQDSGAPLYLFGEGGAEKAAEALGAPFLGAAPIYPELRSASDHGAPLPPDHPASRQFQEFAESVLAFISS